MHRIMPLSQTLRFQTRFGALMPYGGHGQSAIEQQWLTHPDLMHVARTLDRSKDANVLIGLNENENKMQVEARDQGNDKVLWTDYVPASVEYIADVVKSLKALLA